jgi:hypothetical protein
MCYRADLQLLRRRTMSSVTILRLSGVLLAVALLPSLDAPTIAWAQDTQNQPSAPTPSSVPADVTDKLAGDLAKLQASIQASQSFVASPAAWNQVLVTSNNADVLSGASASAAKEFVAQKGEKFHVLDKANAYYAVAADNGRTGWIMAADVKPEPAVGIPVWGTGNPAIMKKEIKGVGTTQEDEGMTARIFKSLTEQAVEFRDSYKDNKYLFVSGFTVHVGIPPSIDLAFTFR